MNFFVNRFRADFTWGIQKKVSVFGKLEYCMTLTHPKYLTNFILHDFTYVIITSDKFEVHA